MSLSPDAWFALCRQLAGTPPSLSEIDLPGLVHRIADEPLGVCDVEGVTSATELALIAGCSRQLAAYHIGRGDPAGALRPRAPQAGRNARTADAAWPKPRTMRPPKHDQLSKTVARRLGGCRR